MMCDCKNHERIAEMLRAWAARPEVKNLPRDEWYEAAAREMGLHPEKCPQCAGGGCCTCSGHGFVFCLMQAQA